MADQSDRREGSVLDSLPVHPVPEGIAEHPILKVDGLVERPLHLTPADLTALPRQPLTSDFQCTEGWSVPDVAWRGVLLRDVLRQAGADPAAGWVQASAGEFSTPLAREAAEAALLALALDGGPLPVEHGGPIRLVVPGGACFTSVKWLDHLEVRAAPAPDTAQQIALDRIGVRGTQAPVAIPSTWRDAYPRRLLACVQRSSTMKDPSVDTTSSTAQLVRAKGQHR